MIKTLKTVSMLLIISSTFSGCFFTNNDVDKPSLTINKVFKPYQTKYKAIVGSRNNDARVIVDQGVILKAWVNTYKDNYGDLVASHDLYIRVKKPDFVTEYATIPRTARKRGLVTPSGKTPFMFSSNEIDRSDISTNKGIKEYTNSYEDKSNPKKVVKRLEEGSKFDKDIKQYLESKKLKQQ